MFGKSKSLSHLGIDIGAGGIKLVELRKEKGRPQLWTYGLADQQLDIHLHADQSGDEKKSFQDPHMKDLTAKAAPQTEEEKKKKKKPEAKQYHFENDERITKYGDLLKELCKQAKTTTTSATASLPVSAIFHALVTLPKVDQKELAHHIRAKIKKMVPTDIEEMQIQFQPIDKQSAKNQKYFAYLVTAAPKRLIAFYTAIFQRAGLQLSGLETEAFALTRSLIGLDTSTSMIVDIGAERTNFFIIDKGLPLTHRSIQSGGMKIDKIISDVLQVETSQASAIKNDVSYLDSHNLDKELFRSVVEPIIKEIDYSFNLFLKQEGNAGKKPEKIILTGGSSVFPLFAQLISERFPMRVYVGDPWARVVYQQGLKKVLDSIGPRMGVAIGTAMREIV